MPESKSKLEASKRGLARCIAGAWGSTAGDPACLTSRTSVSTAWRLVCRAFGQTSDGPQSQHALPSGLSVVTAKALQVSPKAGPVESVQQSLDAWQIQVLLANRKVVSPAHERKEAQAIYLRCRPRRNTAVRCSAVHLPGRRKVPNCDLVVTANAPARNPQALEMRVQQNPAPRAALAVHQ
jgi:hypothetical protein